jgi:hypothetical protein
MKTVAFLQNMWVLPRSVKSVVRFGPTTNERERMIAYALFAGCHTGRVLKRAFGEEACNAIIWQEANPTVADNPKTYYPPDQQHIRAVLDKHQPEAVLCLTGRGFQEVYAACQTWRGGVRFVSAPHPAARGANVFADLVEAARRLKV